MSDLAPITVFFDTEFSSLDENFRELISIGMASEASEDKMYLVLKEGWQGAGVSDFVRDVVLPLMPLHQPEYCSRSGTAARIEEFFDQLRGGDIATPVLLLSDSPIDWTLLVDLFEKDWPAAKNTTWRLIDSELQAINKNPEYEFALEAYFQDRAHRLMKRGGERHHPLVDAMAMRHAFALAGEKKAYGSNSPRREASQ